MKQAINLLSLYRQSQHQTHDISILIGFCVISIFVILYCIIQTITIMPMRQKLQAAQFQLDGIKEHKQQDTQTLAMQENENIDMAIKKLKKEIQTKEEYMKHLSAITNKEYRLSRFIETLANEYVKGTVIDVLHFKDGQLISYQGKTQDPLLIPVVMHRMDAHVQSTAQKSTRVKIYKTSKNASEVYFSVVGE